MKIRQEKGEKLTSLSWGSKVSFVSALNGRALRKSCFLLLQLFLLLLCILHPCLSQPSGIAPVDRGNRPFPVCLSIYVINIGHLDVETGSFSADFYLKLQSDRQYSLESIEFTNGFPSVVELLEETPTMKDYRIQAQLSTAIDLKDYPFDKQILPIIIEDKANTSDKMIFVFDKNNSSVDPDLRLVGWGIEGFKGESQSHRYLINNSTYSRFVFDIYVRRAATTSAVMLFVPAALLVFVSLLTLLLKGQRLSNRISLNGTMLLAAILLHLRIVADLPTRSYLTFADRFMIATYIVLVMTLVSSILLALYAEKGDQRQATFIYRCALLITPILAIAIYIIILIQL